MTAPAGGDALRAEGVGYGGPKRIRVVPLEPEPPDPELSAWLGRQVGELLSTEVVVTEPLPPIPEWWASERAQLDSGAIVDTLIERFPLADAGPPPEWILSITAADLTGGDRDYVFGEAALGGAWAVIATARFGASGEPRFRSRVLTEALHELGHLAGLGHCPDPHCLMAASRDVEELDRKGHALCNECRARSAGAGP